MFETPEGTRYPRRTGFAIVFGCLIYLVSFPAVSEPAESGGETLPDEALFRKAEEWLNALDVNPISLRDKYNMKGIKHFVEAVNGYLDLYKFYEAGEDKKRVRARVEELYKVVENPRYHEFIDDASPQRFRQDIISYLNACVLMREFALDDSAYREQLVRALPRLRDHFDSRGSNQKMAMTLLLEKLGHPIDASPEEFLERSVIRRRVRVSGMDRLDKYSLTHEIFMLTDYGRRDPALTSEDRMYLYQVTPELLRESIETKDVDLCGEWVVALCFLDLADHPGMDTAVELIRRSQNPDGSWGSYEGIRAQIALRPDIAYDVDIGKYLHTTEVAVWALITYKRSLEGL
jgi:hypothetical protein